MMIENLCHAPRERVSWNTTYSTHEPLATSHAPRERVSWNILLSIKLHFKSVTLHVSVWVEILSMYDVVSISNGHAPRERVSWNVTYLLYIVFHCPCHAPRERVSWNAVILRKFEIDLNVTLHVSVWVEIVTISRTNVWAVVTLHVSVWVEITRYK